MAKNARPGVITLLGVLGFISGIVKVLTGLALVFVKDKESVFTSTDITSTAVTWTGVVVILLGAFTLFLANSVMSGQKWAQVWYGIVFTLNLVVGLVGTFANTGTSRWASLTAAIISFIVLQLLFSERVQAYFES